MLKTYPSLWGLWCFKSLKIVFETSGEVLEFVKIVN